VRQHAWEFATQTLPQRESFKTAYDALQLQNCANGTSSSPPAPTIEDGHTPPNYPTPAAGVVIYASSSSSGGNGGGGDGTKAAPFTTLVAAVDAAAFAGRGTVRVFRNFHSGNLEASSLKRAGVGTNGIPLDCPLFLPVDTVNCVQPLKVEQQTSQ
jgi:hypothetical protein